MNNTSLARDLKEKRFLSMKWERNESANEIIAVDDSTRHKYYFTSRKKMNQDWQTLHVLKRQSDNVHH